MSWPERFRRRRRFPFTGDFPPDMLFEDVDDMMREMERAMEEAFREMGGKMPRSLVREKKLPDGSTVRQMGPFVYGYSVTIGPDGKPQIREFGNMKPALGRKEQPLDLKEEREPLVDVLDQGDNVRVVAELPGIPKDSLKVHATANTLTISAEHGERRYSREIELPEEVDPKTAKSTYNNGILEVVLVKRKKDKAEGVQIKVE